jgi:hypothetical protein
LFSGTLNLSVISGTMFHARTEPQAKLYSREFLPLHFSTADEKTECSGPHSSKHGTSVYGRKRNIWNRVYEQLTLGNGEVNKHNRIVNKRVRSLQ